MSNLSIFSLAVLIWPCNSEASFEVTLAEITDLETPQARPSAILEGTKT